MFIGIDVHLKSLMVAVLDEELNICQLASFETEQAAELIKEAKPKVIGIDAPYKLNQGLMNNEEYRTKLQPNLKGHYDKKVSEYELSRRNIQPFSTPGHISKLIGWNAWMWAGFKLYKQIEDLGYEFITSKQNALPVHGFGEVFPHASFTMLLGYIPSAKHTAAGLSERVQILKNKGIKDVELWVTGAKNIQADKLDALAAAYTAYLAVQQKVIFVGEPSEGEIILPKTDFKERYGYSEAYKEERRNKRKKHQKKSTEFEQLVAQGI